MSNAVGFTIMKNWKHMEQLTIIIRDCLGCAHTREQGAAIRTMAPENARWCGRVFWNWALGRDIPKQPMLLTSLWTRTQRAHLGTEFGRWTPGGIRGHRHLWMVGWSVVYSLPFTSSVC